LRDRGAVAGRVLVFRRLLSGYTERTGSSGSTPHRLGLRWLGGPIVAGPNGPPAKFTLITGDRVSAEMRAVQAGVSILDVKKRPLGGGAKTESLHHGAEGAAVVARFRRISRT
jgi:hypothetical protein